MRVRCKLIVTVHSNIQTEQMTCLRRLLGAQVTLQSSLSWHHSGNTRTTVLPPRQEKRVLVRSRECGRFVVTLAVTSYRNLNVTSKCQRSLRDIAGER